MNKPDFMDSSSPEKSWSTPHKSAVSIFITPPSRTREEEEKLSYREGDSRFVEQRNWSFIRFISLVEIFVFVYHVILLAEDGVTVGISGPVYSEVKSAIFDYKSDVPY